MDNNEEKEIVKEETVAKKGKGKGILIGSLIAVIVLLAGVVVYFAFIKDKDKDTKKDDSSKPTNKVDNNTNNNDNNDDNNKPNNNDNDNNVTNTTVSDEKLSSIMKKFKKYGLFELKYGGNQEFSKDKITTYQYQNLESYILSNDTSDNWQEHFDNGEEYSASKSVDLDPDTSTCWLKV